MTKMFLLLLFNA